MFRLFAFRGLELRPFLRTHFVRVCLTMPMRSTQEITQQVQELGQWIAPLREQVGHVVVGQKYLVDRLLLGLLANGHILLEGVPGLAKTLTVKTLAACIQTGFQRLQFTPDLLPADLIGTLIYNPRSGEFTTKLGPIFSNLILADEINRAPGQGAERAPRGDAGTPGHDRRQDLSAARSVPRPRDAKTRSNRKAPTSSPKRSSIVSCSS